MLQNDQLYWLLVWVWVRLKYLRASKDVRKLPSARLWFDHNKSALECEVSFVFYHCTKRETSRSLEMLERVAMMLLLGLFLIISWTSNGFGLETVWMDIDTTFSKKTSISFRRIFNSVRKSSEEMNILIKKMLMHEKLLKSSTKSSFLVITKIDIFSKVSGNLSANNLLPGAQVKW